MPQPPASDLARIARLLADPQSATAEAGAPEGSDPGALEELPPVPDRRRSPRRRLRDRIASLDGAGSPALRAHPVLKDLVALAEDDLRQGAIALSHLERYLGQSLALLDKPDVDALTLNEHAHDPELFDHLDALGESLSALRRRLASLAGALPRK